MNLEFELSKTLTDLINILRNHKIIQLNYYNSIDPGIKAARVLDRPALEEVGFGIFLSWIYSFKNNKHKRASFNFIPLRDELTLFLCSFSTLNYKNGYNQNGGFVKNFFKGIPSGNERHNICPICNMLKFNLGCFNKDLDVSDLPDPSESCSSHMDIIKKWSIKKFEENENYIKMLGGYGCLLHTDPNIF